MRGQVFYRLKGFIEDVNISSGAWGGGTTSPRPDTRELPGLNIAENVCRIFRGRKKSGREPQIRVRAENGTICLLERLALNENSAIFRDSSFFAICDRRPNAYAM
jgi:hypothetical protein